MTTEAWNPPSPATIATTGPYAIPFPYEAATIAASVETIATGVSTDLIFGTDFTVSPAAHEVSGNLTLTAPAFVAHAGKKLHITRQTAEQQGFVGTQGNREKGMERQLDRLTRRVQEVARMARSSVRALVPPLKPFAPAPGRVIIFDALGQPINGPDATDIAQAQANAASAAASAVLADADRIAAQASAALAAASAGSVNAAFLMRSHLPCSISGTASAIILSTGAALAVIPTKFKTWFVPETAATGPSTVQWDANPAVPALTMGGAPIHANYWVAGQIVFATYINGSWYLEPDGLYGAVCAVLEDRQTSGTSGGSSVGGGHVVRVLNTIAKNAGGFVSLAANRFTLQRGLYRVAWQAPAHNVGLHATHLYNVTTSSQDAAPSLVAGFSGASAISTVSQGVALLNIASTPVVYELRHVCTIATITVGLGQPDTAILNPNGAPYGVFSRVEITPLKP